MRATSQSLVENGDGGRVRVAFVAVLFCVSAVGLGHTYNQSGPAPTFITASVGFNDCVKAGQPIAQLDQETFAAQVNEARAALRSQRSSILFSI